MHLVTLLVMALHQAPPDVEIYLQAKRYKVDPDLVFAVAKKETGNIKESERDRVISPTNDYGRFQLNCGTWKKRLNLDSCDRLLDRHYNYATAAWLIARLQKKFGRNQYWIGHYNGGMTASVAYAKDVLRYRREFKFKREHSKMSRLVKYLHKKMAKTS